MNIVDEVEWDLSGMRDRERAWRLLRALNPKELIERVAHEALDNTFSGRTTWEWEPGTHMAGCSRAIFVFPLTAKTFDDFFSGRAGYRAQYYLSADGGRTFNDALVAALFSAANNAFERDPKAPGWEVVEKAVHGPHSKLWINGDGDPFVGAPEREFSPRRWAQRASNSVWLKAPLPSAPAIDLKGTWLCDRTRAVKEDVEYKGDRH